MNGGERTGRRAYTLVEMTVVLTIMGVLTSLALPRFSRSLESARADVAGANLRAIWTAERIYWLDNPMYNSLYSVTGVRTYTLNLADLGCSQDPNSSLQTARSLDHDRTRTTVIW